MNSMLEWALWYAGQGFHVFPLHYPIGDKCSCETSEYSAPCQNIGKHPMTPNGLKDGSTDTVVITEWWTKNPHANIAAATDVSGFWALDIDDVESEEFLGIRDSLNVDDRIPVQDTGGGGIHYLFGTHERYQVRNTQDKIDDGIDTRGRGGYIVLPPSVHASGSLYTWRKDREPSAPIPPTPGWLDDWLELAHGEKHAEFGALLEYEPAPLALPSVIVKDEVISALSCIDATDRETWIRIGMSLHSTGGSDEAFGIWVDWSLSRTQKPEEHKGSDFLGQWQSFRKKPQEISIRTLFMIALESGWEGYNPGDLQPPSFEMQPGEKLRPAEPIRMNSVLTDDGVDCTEFDPNVMIPDELDFLRSMIAENARFENADPGAVFLTSLAVAAHCCAYRVKFLCPWFENSAFWALIVLPSGQNKSGMMRNITKVLVEVDQEQERKARKKELESKKPIQIMAPRHMVTNITDQGLSNLLRKTDRTGILLASAEGGGIGNLVKPNEVKISCETLLSGYSGDHISEVRVLREGANLSDVSVSVAILSQPSIASTLLNHDDARDRGLAQRFVVYCPPARKILNRKDIAPPDLSVFGPWNRMLLSMIDVLPVPMHRRTHVNIPDGITPYLYDIQEKAADYVKSKLGTQGEHFARWHSKRHGLVARVACIYRTMSVFHHGTGEEMSEIEVNDACFKAARNAVTFMENATREAWSGKIETDEIRSSRIVLAMLPAIGKRDERGRHIVSKTDVMIACNGIEGFDRLRKASMAEPLMDILEDLGWGFVEELKIGRAKRKTRYLVVRDDLLEEIKRVHPELVDRVMSVIKNSSGQI